MMKFKLNSNDSDDADKQHLSTSNKHTDPNEHLLSCEQPQQIITVVPIEKDAPTPENWYHGCLDRVVSEERLKLANKTAGFLVRESERKSGSFVLSYYSLKSSIYHFKITAVFGDYYIGGRRFDRLETLISYYMYYSELVKGEKLETPVMPQRICRLERTYLSIKPYHFNQLSTLSRNQNRILYKKKPNELNRNSIQSAYWNNGEDMLFFDKIGERFKVFHEVDDGEWLWAQSFKTNEIGLLNSECVIQIDDFKLHEIEPWFYANITKEEAASILSDAGDCSYLVRPSDQIPGNFTLFFYVDNVVHRYRITSCHDENESNTEFYSKYYSIGGRDFTSISSIIERYMNEDIAEGYRLTKVPHKRPEYYSQSMSAFLKSYLIYKKIDFKIENSERLEKSCSFKLKSTSLKPHDSYMSSSTTVTDFKRSNQTDFISMATTNNKYLSIPDTNHANKLTQSLNESAMNNVLSSNSKLAQQSNHIKPALAAENTTPKNSLTTSKTISSPFSSIILQSNSTLVNSASFKDLRNYELINQFESSRNSKKIFCGNLAKTSITIKPINSDLLNKKPDSNFLTGFLNKYNEKTKKWKPYWFMLKQTDQQLFYFSNEKKLKEKGLIDLSYGFYYPVDDSFFNKPFCFQIIIQTLGNNSTQQSSQNGNSMMGNNIAHYLAADSSQLFKEWTESIRPSCNPIQFNPFLCQPFGTSSMSCLSLSSSSSSSSNASSSSTTGSTDSSSSSASSSLSSPLSTSDQINQDHHHRSNLNTKQSEQTKSFNHKNNPSNFDKNFRILRTLSVDIHEARNVCFSPLFNQKAALHETKSLNSQNNQHQNTSSPSNHLHNLPKYHKDNLYYCVILFNNEAYVASTRHTTCNNLHATNTSSGLVSLSHISGSNNHQSSMSSSYHGNSGSSIGNSGGFDIMSSQMKQVSKDSIWDDSFSFDNLPLDVKELKLCLYVIAKPTNFSASFVNNLKKISQSNAPSKMLDPLLIGSVNIRLDELINKGLHETWYNVEPEVHINNYYSDSTHKLGQNGFSKEQSSQQPQVNCNCTLRAKIRFCEEKIYLNRDHYKDLCAYLMDEREHKHLCTLYEQIIPSTERSHFVQSLIRFYIVKNQLVEMLKSFLLTEIDRCADLSTLFRPATMSTSLMDQYMRTRCDEFLRKALEEPLVKILRQNQTSSAGSTSNTSQNSSSNNTNNTTLLTPQINMKSFELDPAKCKDAQQRELNLANFQSALKELINSICNPNAVSLFPNELKHLFYLVRQHVHLKWKQQQCNNNGNDSSILSIVADDKLVRIYCVSAFVFLRLLCPALLNPKNFGLKFYDNLNGCGNGNGSMSSSSTSSISTSSSSLNVDNNKHAANNVLNYVELANQFSVFSPAFMFSLSPTKNTRLTQQTCEMNTPHQQQAPLAKNGSNASSQVSLQLASVYERYIKLLAKVLQTLANMTECKEPFMLPLSDFLNVNKPNVVKFIEDISNLNELNSTHVIKLNENSQSSNETSNNTSNSSEDNIKSELNIQFENASCKYLAVLYRLLSSFVPQMKLYLAKSTSSSINAFNESIHNIDDCLDADDNDSRRLKEEESNFAASLQKLINILNDINKKT